MAEETRARKHRLALSDDELRILDNILHHFSDYVGFDDRPDHGWNMQGNGTKKAGQPFMSLREGHGGC